jgi:hypothetical protein
MIYLSFIVWMLLIVVAGIGLYRLWAGRLRPAWVNWALLPGTVVSEMAYILGCMITGGEVRHARLIDTSGRGGEARTDATGGIKFLSPLVASLMALVACGAAILAAYRLLGEPVLVEFTLGVGGITSGGLLPKELPDSWPGLWSLLQDQLGLVRRTLETWAKVDWVSWRVPLFVYLSMCLSIRLAPVTRAVRPTLLATVALALIIALVGLIWPDFEGLMDKVWPLLTYVWATLLVLLVLTLVTIGLVSLGRVLAGKEKSGGSK